VAKNVAEYTNVHKSSEVGLVICRERLVVFLNCSGLCSSTNVDWS